LWWGCEQVAVEGLVKYGIRSLILSGYLALVWKTERPLLSI
jgi:hypothetical protein